VAWIGLASSRSATGVIQTPLFSLLKNSDCANDSLVRCVITRYNRTMIQIVDYGMGNLRSVQKAFEKLSVPAEICTRPENLKSCDKLVLPGVGAFRRHRRAAAAGIH
jgi:hypothetical protein